MKCTVVVPIFKVYPTEEEKEALVQCIKIFHEHSIILICPKNFDESCYLKISKGQGIIFRLERFENPYFLDIGGYNRLMLSLEFYKRFRSFDYILIYQLDAWVFRDELIAWCNKRYDYIGAPWFENWHNAFEDSPIIGVGNGGLSLRNVKKTIRLLNRMKMAGWLHNHLVKENFFAKMARRLKFYPKLLKFTEERRAKGINEDYQIYLLSKVYPWYNIAPVEDAIRFSFDVNPRVLYRMNNYKLPFGCHAWKKHDSEFWDRFIVLDNKNQ